MRVECFLKFMLRYCWDKIVVAGGNVERVFSINSASVTSWPQSRSWATVRWSSELKETKSGKTNTRKLIQSVRAWGRNKICWWWKRAWSCAHRSAGPSTSKYYSHSVWFRCRHRSSNTCHLHTAGMLSTAVGAVEVDAIGVISVLAKSSTFSIVFSSLIHSRKLEPSDFRGRNINAWSQDSATVGYVAWDSLWCLYILKKIGNIFVLDIICI